MTTINQMPQVRANVRSAIVAYLSSFISPGTGNGYIPFLANVFDYPAKVTNEGELFLEDGIGTGAAIWLFFPDDVDSRFELPGNFRATGRTGAAVEFQLRMICQLVSMDPQSQVAGRSNEQFLDGLKNAIRFDPNAGTGSSGNSSGVIWQWGKGSFPIGGPDIRVTCYEPKGLAVVTVESHLEVTIVTFIDTTNG